MTNKTRSCRDLHWPIAIHSHVRGDQIRTASYSLQTVRAPPVLKARCQGAANKARLQPIGDPPILKSKRVRGDQTGTADVDRRIAETTLRCLPIKNTYFRVWSRDLRVWGSRVEG